MSQPGIGAMLHYLSGGSANPPEKYYGKKIVAANLDENKLNLAFEDGAQIAVFDDGQSCCESRYMATADDVSWLVGKTLKAINTKAGPDEPDDYGTHEVVFLEIMTEDGCITFANHNEHNGYYGGFGLTIEEREREVE